MSQQPKKGGYIQSAWLVIVLALVYGAGLAGVEIALKDRILQNKKDKIFLQLPALVPGAVPAKTERLSITEERAGQPPKVSTLYKLYGDDRKLVGWVALGVGMGFADRIELLVGFNADRSAITGIFVLSQKETPGLGDYITGEDFRRNFEGVPGDGSLTVVKMASDNPNEIHAISGATISSVSVTDIVNTVSRRLAEAEPITPVEETP